MQSTSDVNLIKHFFHRQWLLENKVECLSLASLFNLHSYSQIGPESTQVEDLTEKAAGFFWKYYFCPKNTLAYFFSVVDEKMLYNIDTW